MGIILYKAYTVLLPKLTSICPVYNSHRDENDDPFQINFNYAYYSGINIPWAADVPLHYSWPERTEAS